MLKTKQHIFILLRQYLLLEAKFLTRFVLTKNMRLNTSYHQNYLIPFFFIKTVYCQQQFHYQYQLLIKMCNSQKRQDVIKLPLTFTIAPVSYKKAMGYIPDRVHRQMLCLSMASYHLISISQDAFYSFTAPGVLNSYLV